VLIELTAAECVEQRFYALSFARTHTNGAGGAQIIMAIELSGWLLRGP